MDKNFVGEMDSLFHPFCSKECPCLAVYNQKESYNADNVEIEVGNYVTCDHYEFCAKFVPAIRDGRVNINADSVSNADTKK